MLVSCSIDNKVIVWRLPETDGEEGLQLSRLATAKILNPFQSLEQHTSFVKVCVFLSGSAAAAAAHAPGVRRLAASLLLGTVCFCGR